MPATGVLSAQARRNVAPEIICERCFWVQPGLRCTIEICRSACLVVLAIDLDVHAMCAMLGR